MADYENPYWTQGSTVQPGYEEPGLLDNPLINNFATRGLLSGVQWLGETLGKPQAALFGALKGDFAQLANLIPFSDTLGITNTGDPEKGLTTQRVGGRDLLRHYGAVDKEDNYGNFAGGLALDILADPLAFVRGPLGALTKAGDLAQKGSGTARTIAGRMAKGEGGLFSITNKPWYAELLPGAKKAENVFVAGVDDFGKGAFNKVAQGMESGWNRATEATIPGTNFSPVAWMRSALEPGAANTTGFPQAVKTFGEHNQPRYNQLVDEGAEMIGQTDILGKQADSINRLAGLGLDNAESAKLTSRVGRYIHETGADAPAPWQRSVAGSTPGQVSEAISYGKEYSTAANKVTAGPRQAALEVGRDVGDITESGWKFQYGPRGQADMGNRLAMHAEARNADFALAPGGGAMVEEMMIGPASGAKHINGLDVQAVVSQEVAFWTPHIQQEAMNRLSKVYPATAQDVPEALIKLTTQEGAAEYAAKMIGYATDLSPDVAKRGFFYRPDLGGELNSYAKGFTRPTAVASSAIQTLKEYSDDFQKLAGQSPTTDRFIRLDDAMNEIGLRGGKAELAKRLGISEKELAERGVTKDLVEALRQEVNPPQPRPKSNWSRAVDAFRYGVTIPWPANFVRNWSSSLVDQGMVGTGATKGLRSAIDITRGALTDPKEYARLQPLMQKAIEHGVIGTDQVKALLGEGFDRVGNAAMNVKQPQVGKTWTESLLDFFKPMTSAEAGRGVGVVPVGEIYRGKTYSAAANAVPESPVATLINNTPVAKVSKKELYRQGLDEAKEISRDTWAEAFQGTQGFTKESMDTVAHSYLGMFERMAEKAGVPIKKSPINILLDHARPEYGNKQQWLAAAKTHNKGIKKSVQDFVEDLAAHKSSGEAIDISDYLAPMMQDVGEAVRQGGWDVRGSYNLSHSPDIAQPVSASPAKAVKPAKPVKNTSWKQDVISGNEKDVKRKMLLEANDEFNKLYGHVPAAKDEALAKSFAEDMAKAQAQVDKEEAARAAKSVRSVAKPGSKLQSELDAAFAESDARMAAEAAGVSQPVKSAVDVVSPTGQVSSIRPPSSTDKAKQWLVDQIGTVVDPFRRYMGTMETAHHFQNEVTRLQQFVNLVEDGYSPAAAAKRVKVNQRDFLDGSTPFVSGTLRDVIPFANFSYQNIKAQADMLSRETGRYSALMNVLNSGRESGGFVPGYASSGSAIPLPGAEDGQQRFLGSLGLTQEDEAMSALASLASGRVTEGVRKLASSSNPLLKMPFEIASGTQLFSGRKLDDLQPGAIPSLLTGGNTPAARFLSQLASGTPAARAFSTVDRLADMERRGPLNVLANLTTGIRTIDVDQQAAAQIAARDTITKLLNASDQFKLRDQLVVDAKWKERGEEMPPEIAELFRQYQWLQREGKAAVKEKQMAAGR